MNRDFHPALVAWESTWVSGPPEDLDDERDEELAETDTDELYTLLAMAEDAATDPVFPARVRHQCDAAVGRLRAELERRACEHDDNE